jgi:hypothetical protein
MSLLGLRAFEDDNQGLEPPAESRRVPDLSGSSTVTPDWGIVARRIRDEATDN